MKFHLLCLIIAAVLLLKALVITQAAEYTASAPLSFPWTARSRDKNSADNYIANGTPFAHSTIIVNGNIALELHNDREKCCERPRPALPYDYSIIAEDEEYITAIKYHPVGQIWNDARKTCLHEGGFLAFPTSSEEEDLYLKTMDNYGLDRLWIGIHDYFQDGDYATVLGEIANENAYYTWLPGEPNNAGGSEPCTAYWRRKELLGLNDCICSNLYPFNCKIKLRKN